MAKVSIVHTGICTLHDGKPGAVFQQNGRELIFSRKSVPAVVIGGIYEVEQTGDTTYQLSGRKYLGMHDDREQVAKWQLAAKSRQLIEESTKAEKSAAAVSAAMEVMEPLLRVYRTALPNRKRIIEAMLLEYLRR